MSKFPIDNLIQKTFRGRPKASTYLDFGEEIHRFSDAILLRASSQELPQSFIHWDSLSKSNGFPFQINGFLVKSMDFLQHQWISKGIARLSNAIAWIFKGIVRYCFKIHLRASCPELPQSCSAGYPKEFFPQGPGKSRKNEKMKIKDQDFNRKFSKFHFYFIFLCSRK